MTAPTVMHTQYMGMRAGYVLGSIAEGGSVVTLASDDHSFKPGSKLIMEVGGEAGAGARATIGVGGTWPQLRFATEAELLASEDPADPGEGFAVACALDTGNVWVWDDDPPELAHWEQPGESLYSVRQFLPRALLATVVSVDGAELTINATAIAASTNAKVWYDNTDLLQFALSCAGGSLRVPAEEQPYAVRGKISTFGVTADEGVLFGDASTTSRFYQPQGCAALTIELHDSPDVVLRDLGFERGWIEEALWNGAEGYVFEYPHMLRGISALRTQFLRCRFTNGVWGEAVHSLCTDSEIRECEIVRTVDTRHYVSWGLQLAECTGSTIVDCSSDGDTIHEAFELFQCTDCSIENFTSRNGVGATNSSANPVFAGLDVTLDGQLPAYREANDPFLPNAVLNWNNAFTLASAEGGSLSDSTFAIEAEPGGLISCVLTRHSALLAAGDPITFGPGIEVITNGHVLALNAEVPSGTAQTLNVDGFETDGVVRLHYGSVANTTAPELQYCPDDVTLGSGNDIDTLTVSGC